MMRSFDWPALLVACALGLAFAVVGCGGDDTDSSRANAPQTTEDIRRNRIQSPDPYPVPDTTLQTLDGGSINLAEQDGRVLLVNFWATWCAPCREEIPDLIELQDDLGPDGLTVVGISLDQEGASVVRSFMSNYDFNYPLVADPGGAVEAQFGATYGLPTTFVVNPEGQVVRRVLGIFPTDRMRPELDSMLTARGSQGAT